MQQRVCDRIGTSLGVSHSQYFLLEHSNMAISVARVPVRFILVHDLRLATLVSCQAISAFGYICSVANSSKDDVKAVELPILFDGDAHGAWLDIGKDFLKSY